MLPGYARILTHVVFSTKRQEPYLADGPLREAVHAALAETCDGLGAAALAVGGTADHVHLLVRSPASLAAADLIRELKRESFTRVKQNFPDLARFHWQGGYGAFSVSASRAGPVRRYVRSQAEHHRNVSFRDEFRSLLARHRIPFEEPGVWD